MIYHTLTEKEKRIAAGIVHAGFDIHRNIGPGLLEKIFWFFFHEHEKSGFHAQPQARLPKIYAPCIKNGIKRFII